MTSLASKLSAANETAWMRLGSISELMHDPEKAMFSYENALRHNPYNVKALTQIASICRLREQYPKAVEYFQRILNIENNNGEIWGALGHCYLMMDDLQKAYTAYQQALYHLPNPKDPNLWYGIGILYDRYGSFEHAEEAFTAVLKMDPKFEKSNEIYFRLGIIYKQQIKYDQALECFRYILQKPPRPLTQGDIWFQIGHVYELQKDFNAAKDAYERVLKETPNHAKALQQLGWLFHSNMGNQEVAISYLMRSIDADPSDGQTWYLLGRCYMAQQQYRKAYDAYQQAVYRDGRNPTFWCSIGVLYYQINQYRDALDAYSRAIRLNPYLSEVWYDLGTLYESCNQISDSLDAYQRAAELDPGNKHIQQRLNALRDQNNKVGSSESESNEARSLDKTPMTMEPRATPHTVNDRPRSPRVGSQSVLNVPDLVDLSNNHDNRTLPSADNFNSPPPREKVSNGTSIERRSIDTHHSHNHRDSPITPISDLKDEGEPGMEIVEEDQSPTNNQHETNKEDKKSFETLPGINPERKESPRRKEEEEDEDEEEEEEEAEEGEKMKEERHVIENTTTTTTTREDLKKGNEIGGSGSGGAGGEENKEEKGNKESKVEEEKDKGSDENEKEKQIVSSKSESEKEAEGSDSGRGGGR